MYTVGRDWRPEPKNSDSEFCDAPGMVNELNGVGRSAASALDRRTKAASAKPPGVMVMPLKWMDTGPCMGFWSGLEVVCESCRFILGFALLSCGVVPALTTGLTVTAVNCC